MKNWIHLSDIHYIRSVGEKDLRENLLNKLEAINNEKKIDYLFITGDFRHAGEQKDIDNKLIIKETVSFIKKVCDRLELSDKIATNVFLVPGNHDIERDGELINVVRTIRDRDFDPLSESQFTEREKEYLNSKLSFFDELESQLYGKEIGGKKKRKSL